MAEYVNDLPDGEESPATNPADVGLAGELKEAGLVEKSRPAREVEQRRPIGVLAAAALMFAGAAWMMPFVLLTSAGVPPAWVGGVVGFATLLGVVSSMAMWMMKRWSVFVYTLAVIINNVLFLVIEQWSVFHLIIPLVVLAVAYSQLKHLE